MASASKRILVCGASGGLGQIVAETLQSNGMTVCGTMRSPPTDEGVYSFPMLPMDVVDEASVKACIDKAIEKMGRIDAVVNCVNEMILGTVEETSLEEVSRVYDINVLGLANICRQVIPSMKNQSGGLILTMSSLGGLLAVPYLSSYTSSKFALEAFSEALYHEMKPYNIDVVIMQPVAMRMDRPSTGDHLKMASGAGPDSLSHKMAEMMGKDTRESKLTPQMVADKIDEVIQSKRRKLRYPMDRAKIISLVRRIAPQGMIDQIIKGATPKMRKR